MLPLARIDARGMSCPQPILMTKNAIKSDPKSVEVIVDDNTAKNNVSRFLENAGYKLNITDTDEDYLICAKR